MFIDLVQYGLRLAPGLLLLASCLILTRRLTTPLPSIMVWILTLILIRDTMTPEGLWHLGVNGQVGVWVRLIHDPVVLVTLGATTLVLSAGAIATDARLKPLVTWGRLTPTTAGAGIGGGLLAAAPVLAVSASWPLDERGGTVATALLPALVFFCLTGNLFEELLFRGFLQGYLETITTPVRAAALSGVLFASCHTFLATTVTDIGAPLLVFTLWEGLICAWLRLHFGLIPAVIAHGLAIAALTSGLL